CHGTFLWTTVYKGYQEEPSKKYPVVQEDTSSEHIQIPSEKMYEPGEEVTVRLQNLTPDVPALVTAERDGIYWKQVFSPKQTEEAIKLKITEQMLPETIITLYQPGRQSTLYDMKKLDIKRDQKKLTYQKNGGESEWKLAGGEASTELSEITFELYDDKSYEEDVLLRSFYPTQGTSVITSSNGTPFAKNSEQNQSYQFSNGEFIPDLITIDGVLRKEPVEQKMEQSFYMVAHDKAGHFGNVILSGVRNEEKKITIDLHAPSFIREKDQMIFSLDIANNFDENKNLELVSASKAFQFLT